MTNEIRSTKRALNPTHVILTLVGIAGLALFILACKPSWSPDAQKVLYTYHDEAAQKSAIALFDRRTHQTRVLFEFTEEGPDGALMATQWTKDGQTALAVTSTEEGAMYVLALPLGSGKPLRAYTMKKMADSDDVPMPPFPQIGNQLILAGRNEAIRLNLETGEVLREEHKEHEAIFFSGGPGKLRYFAEVREAEPPSAQEPNKSSTKHGEVIGYELGEVDVKDLSQHPTLTLNRAQLKTAYGIDGIGALLDVNARTGDVAMLAGTDEGEINRVVLMGNSGVKKVLDPGVGPNKLKLGSVEWSRDGKVLYVGALIDDPSTKAAEFAVLEVAVDGTRTRVNRIDKRPKDEVDDDYIAAVQIALSPDGALIAASTGDLDRVRPEQRGLYLLDVSKPERQVHFYPAPALPAMPK